MMSADLKAGIGMASSAETISKMVTIRDTGWNSSGVGESFMQKCLQAIVRAQPSSYTPQLSLSAAWDTIKYDHIA
jgi:hypothetical protein